MMHGTTQVMADPLADVPLLDEPLSGDRLSGDTLSGDRPAGDSQTAPVKAVPAAEEPNGEPVDPSDVSRATNKQFRQACGQRNTYVVRISSSLPGQTPEPVLWDQPSLIVGRGADCDLRLPHSEISREHAYFQVLGDRVYCADLASRTGTHWSNGATQAGWVPLDEPVSLGPYSLTFEPAACPSDWEESGAESTGESTGETIGETAATGEDDGGLGREDDTNGSRAMFLDFVNAGRKVRRYRVTRDVTLIGSSGDVKIQLSHPSVSNVHCSVVRTPTGLWLVDLLSADGTIVNGLVEPLAPLQPGDEFQVGRFLVAVRYEDSDDSEGSEHRGPSSHADRAEQGGTPNGRSRKANSDRSPVASDFDQTQPGGLSALNQLARMTAGRQHAGGVPAPVEGLSEQFVLGIIKELGVMQQQALQHAQQAMRETVSQLSSTYQQRIDALEHQHAALRDQLNGFLSATAADSVAPLRLQANVGNEHARPDGDAAAQHPPGPQDARETVPFLPVEQDVFDEVDPQQREQWIRGQLKTIEKELDKTRQGWGKKLVDILGY